jgi:hypothetical protein
VRAALIFLWDEDELTFNHNFAKRDQLYRVMQNEKSDAGVSTIGSTTGSLAEALKEEMPGVINSGRLSWAILLPALVAPTPLFLAAHQTNIDAQPKIKFNKIVALQ